MIASDGKKYKSQAATVEGLLRIIQSIPSKKAEPFKLWLAKVGKERVDEEIDPELEERLGKPVVTPDSYLGISRKELEE